MSLFSFLAEDSLTELRLIRDRALGRFDLFLARTFDDTLDFRGYADRFVSDSVPCGSPCAIGDREARARIQAAGLESYVAKIESRMTAGRHEMMVLRLHRGLSMRTALFIHSSELGKNNGLHAMRAGGFRRHDLHEDELDVFTDGLNLGRAMSFKNAAADLPLGGCKMTVQAAPVAIDDLARLGFIAYAIDAGRFVTGPDMGFLPEHSDVMRAHFSKHATGGNKGPIGPTGTPTALGVFLAIQEAAAFAFGARDLENKRALVQGVGAVGLPLAIHLRKAGARIAIADPDPRALERAKHALGAVEVIAPEAVLATASDIFVPCAMGGILDRDSIARLSTKMIYGSANNPLKALSKEDELVLAEALAARGILFQIEWTHNTAGVMAGFEEYKRGDEASIAHLMPRLERTCRDGTRRILEEARARGKTPTRVAYEAVERRIYPAPEPR
jgi:glutamate dehydrogenase/leucine dehydrogenase